MNPAAMPCWACLNIYRQITGPFDVEELHCSLGCQLAVLLDAFQDAWARQNHLAFLMILRRILLDSLFVQRLRLVVIVQTPLLGI